MNGMLATLRTSHTHYFPATDPRHFQLLGVFEFVAPDDQPARFTFDGIGIDTKTIDGKVFVSAVFDGLPADQAGLQFGDEIISVDSAPYHPVNSFRGKSGNEVEVKIRRTSVGQPETIRVPVQAINGRTMFETALDSSARIIERDGKSIGYVHVWSYAGIKYHEQLQALILWDKLSQCDSLIVDFRDGWGGASLDYVNLFREPLVEIESKRRDGQSNSFTGVWGKPVALLINGGTTSGKELYAFAFHKHKLGAIVGENSAGAVVAGQCIPLSNGDVLYLAVSDLRIDGRRLEGVGVEPDHNVARPIPYANGADPQLEKAVEILAQNPDK
jgi:carboxyl-terminal processing protease